MFNIYLLAQNAFQDWHQNKMAEDAEVALGSSTSSSSGKTSVENLMNIITEPADGFFCLPSDAYNEVFDGILIGEG